MFCIFFCCHPSMYFADARWRHFACCLESLLLLLLVVSFCCLTALQSVGTNSAVQNHLSPTLTKALRCCSLRRPPSYETMSDRPRRSSAMKLTSEQMKDMLDSHSDCSDDDPDFSFERNKKQGKASWLSRQGASSSSEEVDDPDEKAGRRKVARKEKTPKEPGATKRPVGRPRKDSARPPEANTPRRPRGRPSKSHANGGSPAAVTPTATTLAVTTLAAATPAATTPAATNGSGPAETSGQTSSGTPPAQAVPSQVVPSQVAPSQVAAVRSTPVKVNLRNGVPVVMPTTSPRQSQSPHDYYCCVRGCKSRDTTDKDGLWLFALPEDPELRRVWDERLPINHERNRPQSPRVCFRHFDKDDYVRRQQRVAGLRQGALPLIETGRT